MCLWHGAGAEYMCVVYVCVCVCVCVCALTESPTWQSKFYWMCAMYALAYNGTNHLYRSVMHACSVSCVTCNTISLHYTLSVCHSYRSIRLSVTLYFAKCCRISCSRIFVDFKLCGFLILRQNGSN